MFLYQILFANSLFNSCIAQHHINMCFFLLFNSRYYSIVNDCETHCFNRKNPLMLTHWLLVTINYLWRWRVSDVLTGLCNGHYKSLWFNKKQYLISSSYVLALNQPFGIDYGQALAKSDKLNQTSKNKFWWLHPNLEQTCQVTELFDYACWNNYIFQ